MFKPPAGNRTAPHCTLEFKVNLLSIPIALCGSKQAMPNRDDRVVGDADAISDAMAAAPVGVTAYYVDRLSKWDGEEEGERFRFATNFAKVMEVD